MPEGVIMTFPSGEYIDPLDLDPAKVHPRDIIHHLSHQCRYSGATRGFYSVGQHSVLCARRAAEKELPLMTQYQALWHDAAEYALQDMVRPLKERERYGQAYRGAERRAEKVIFEVLGVETPLDPVVREIDVELLAAERRDLLPPNGRWGVLDNVVPPAWRITCWDPPVTRQRFMQTHLRLLYHLGGLDG